MAELFGKESGVAHGRGGSMHLLDVKRRFFGGWGIVGAHLPIATGTALALTYNDLPHAVLCQFGDGAVQAGSFHEALNLAAIWGLPTAEQIHAGWAAAATEVKESTDEALAATFPDPDTLYEHVYGDPAWREQFSRMRAGAPFGERGEERSWQT